MLKLGVPSKGRLRDATFQWFGDRGITLSLAGTHREYAGKVDGVEGVELVLLSAADIPGELRVGRIHLGVTGSDLVREFLPTWREETLEVTKTGFGHADLVIAVPSCWIDVDTLDDLDAVAAAFRRVHGHRLRIATKYHRLVREFLKESGVADYLLVDSQGATEGTVRNLTAEAVADIVSTGRTLQANGLKILSDGVIHRSQAVLFQSQCATWDESETARLETLKTLLNS